MKLTISIEIADDVILKALENNKATEELLKSVGTRVQVSLKEDFVRTALAVCKEYKIPLADFISSKDQTVMRTKRQTPSLLESLFETTASLIGFGYMIKLMREECKKSPALRAQVIKALETFVNELKNMK